MAYCRPMPEAHYIECLRFECGLRFPAERLRPCPMCDAETREIPEAQDAARRASTFENTSVLPLSHLTLALDNVRSAYNVGALMRTAVAFGMTKIITGGITPGADHPKVKKTSLGAESALAHRSTKNLKHLLETDRHSRPVWILEQKTGAVPLSHAFSQSSFRAATPATLVVGNEIAGIDPGIIALAACAIEIPLPGPKESLGVVAAFAAFCGVWSLPV